MKLINDAEFLVIDFETITPKGRSPEPIEVGILRIKQNKIDNNASIDWLIKPPEGLHLTRFDIFTNRHNRTRFNAWYRC